MVLFMRTIAPPPVLWGAPLAAPGRFTPNRRNGKRVPGWEDVSIKHLAIDTGISFRYLLAVLCGQRNCTLALLQTISQALGITLPELITRMERAYELRMAAALNPIDKNERRRERSERRAIQQQST